MPDRRDLRDRFLLHGGRDRTQECLLHTLSIQSKGQQKSLLLPGQSEHRPDAGGTKDLHRTWAEGGADHHRQLQSRISQVRAA